MNTDTYHYITPGSDMDVLNTILDNGLLLADQDPEGTRCLSHFTVSKRIKDYIKSEVFIGGNKKLLADILLAKETLEAKGYLFGAQGTENEDFRKDSLLMKEILSPTLNVASLSRHKALEHLITGDQSFFYITYPYIDHYLLVRNRKELFVDRGVGYNVSCKLPFSLTQCVSMENYAYVEYMIDYLCMRYKLMQDMDNLKHTLLENHKLYYIEGIQYILDAAVMMHGYLERIMTIKERVKTKGVSVEALEKMYHTGGYGNLTADYDINALPDDAIQDVVEYHTFQPNLEMSMADYENLIYGLDCENILDPAFDSDEMKNIIALKNRITEFELFFWYHLQTPPEKDMKYISEKEED